MGGNRKLRFIYEYLEFCIRKKLFEQVDTVIETLDFDKLIAYNSEEEEIRVHLKVLLLWYKNNKDTEKLAHEFVGIASKINILKELESDELLRYIDLDQTGNIKEILDNYEKYLFTISPNRPLQVLTIIAHLLSKIIGEEEKASNYYSEVYEIIKSNIMPEHFDILHEYAKFSSNLKFLSKSTIYKIEPFAKVFECD